MDKKSVAPYGSWKSPITSDLIASATIALGQICLDGENTYWIEMRPAEGGRHVIVRRTPDGRTSDVNPQPFNARSRVHEYGGGAYTVDNGDVYFANFDDQRLYTVGEGDETRPITPAAAMRYADLLVDRRHNRLLCVREDHTGQGEAVNTLVAIDLGREDAGRILVSGNDFYASPRLNPDGTRLAWLTWNHPNMPWDGTELWLAEVKPDGSLGQKEFVAGGNSESIFQPEWSPGGELLFISDRSGWWNLYRFREGAVESVYELEAEFGQPQWVFGMSTYATLSAEHLACTYTQRGVWYLAKLDLESGQPELLELPYTAISGIQAAPDRLVFQAASPAKFPSIVEMALDGGEAQVLRRSSEVTVDEGYLSPPEAIEFPTDNDLTAHAWYYKPTNKDYRAPSNERPPLLVMSHGGPTSDRRGSLNLGVQYWTSRGIAVVDVNYGGSTGYGRAYRERLRGQWGVVDVNDCLNSALYLIDRGQADADRLAIRGGSAGGYTTLCALTFRDAFKVGASYYGVSDLAALAEETHKFESRYLDSIVGPYPQQAELYRERSPLHHVDRLACAMILFQGLEDAVVPPNQAELMLEAVRKKGLPVAYLPFEGEQHGFRQAKNIQRALEAELYFYGKVLGFEVADHIEPVPIENL